MSAAEIEAKYLINAGSVLGESAAETSLALLKVMERHRTGDILQALTPAA